MLSTFWCKSGSYQMILHPIIMKNVSDIPWTETIHKIAYVVAKLSFHLLFTITFTFYLIWLCYLNWWLAPVIHYQALVWAVQTFSRSVSENFKKYFLKKFRLKFLNIFWKISRSISKIIPEISRNISQKLTRVIKCWTI